jgi:hypothetical protein
LARSTPDTSAPIVVVNGSNAVVVAVTTGTYRPTADWSASFRDVDQSGVTTR